MGLTFAHSLAYLYCLMQTELSRNAGHRKAVRAFP